MFRVWISYIYHNRISPKRHGLWSSIGMPIRSSTRPRVSIGPLDHWSIWWPNRCALLLAATDSDQSVEVFISWWSSNVGIAMSYTTHQNGDEWGLVYGIAIASLFPAHQQVQQEPLMILKDTCSEGGRRPMAAMAAIDMRHVTCQD